MQQSQTRGESKRGLNSHVSPCADTSAAQKYEVILHEISLSRCSRRNISSFRKSSKSVIHGEAHNSIATDDGSRAWNANRGYTVDAFKGTTNCGTDHTTHGRCPVVWKQEHEINSSGCEFVKLEPFWSTPQLSLIRPCAACGDRIWFTDDWRQNIVALISHEFWLSIALPTHCLRPQRTTVRLC